MIFTGYNVIKTAIYSKGLTFTLTLVAIFAGWMSFQVLPIDAVPDITNVQVQVNTAVEGLIPEEIEKFITYPVESEMGGIPDVDEIRSKAMQNQNIVEECCRIPGP